MRRSLLLLVVLIAVVALALSGCSWFRSDKVTFYRDNNDDSDDAKGPTRASGGFEITQLNISTSGATGIPTVWAKDDGGDKVPIRVQGDPACISVAPEGSAYELSVEGVTGGQAVIETIDGQAELPVVVYNNAVRGQPGYVYHGFIVTADGHESTDTRELAHFWSEWHAELGGNDWRVLVPAYIAGAVPEPLDHNFETLAAVKTVDAEQFSSAPAEQWLERSKIYICQVPDGFVKISSTPMGVFWFFSPSPNFP